MHMIATTITPTDIAVIGASYCTVTLSTVNSRYTLVKRPSGCVLVNDGTGEVRTGVGAYVTHDHRLVFQLADRSAWLTTPVVQAYVLEN